MALETGYLWVSWGNEGGEVKAERVQEGWGHPKRSLPI